MTTTSRTSRVTPVSKDAIERLRDLVPMAPLHVTDDSRAVDEKPARAGRIEIVTEDGETWAEMAPAACCLDGSSCLFDDRGHIAECWQKAA